MDQIHGHVRGREINYKQLHEIPKENSGKSQERQLETQKRAQGGGNTEQNEERKFEII
jgi:hypothetical protein